MRTFPSASTDRVLILVLVFAVLNLFQGCSVYRLVEKDPKKESLLQKYVSDGKYFILYNLKGVYHLSDIEIRNDTLYATASELSAEHIPFIILAGEKPPAKKQPRNSIIDDEVILNIPVDVPFNNAKVSIPLSLIDKMQEYKWSLTSGAVAAIVLSALVPVVLIGVYIGYTMSAVNSCTADFN
jgi:hypothetical protein